MSRASTLVDIGLPELDFAQERAEREYRRSIQRASSKGRSQPRVLGEDEDEGSQISGTSAYRWAEELYPSPATLAPSAAVDNHWREEAGLEWSQPLPWPYAPIDREAYDYFRPDHEHDMPAPSHSPLRYRLGLPGKRLPLFIILSMMAVGLVVAITPVLAKGRMASNTKQANLALSGYIGGSVADDQVPVIDATSQQPVVQGEVQKVNIQDAKPDEIVGPPSLSVSQIEAVLKQYGSPAAGKGQTLYDLGVKYGIDPAYALAFFVHESGCGTKGVARFTKSLGNIRTTPGYSDYQGYRSYPTWESGMEDWYKLISELYIGQWGLRTVDAIIPVYAPWGDNNNPPAYIASVKGMVNSWRGK